MMAGLVMTSYIVVEVMLLGQGVSWIERLYFGLSLLIAGLATSLWITEFRHHRFHQADAGRKKEHSPA